MQYKTTLNPTPVGRVPFPGADASYRAYGQNHGDVLAALRDSNAASFDIAQAKAESDQQLRQQEAQNQLVLQGLRQMDQAQQNDNSLRASRLSTLTGSVGSLLGGLFK